VPRSLWTGSLSFGLVNVPVSLESAVRDLDFHFRQIHEKDGAPIEVKRFCEKEDREVEYEEITHGYELDDGGQVIVSDLELQAIEPRRTRTIDIEQFVDLEDVDPVYFDHPYFLVPASDDDGSVRAYRLLAEVMGQTERAALGRFVMRAKEYLAIIRQREGALTLTTMRFADEVRSTKDVDAATQKSHKPTKKQLDAAVAVIEELSCEWEPDKFKDRYRARLKRVVDRKRKGETIKPPSPVETPPPQPDLMAALEQTLERLQKGQTAAK
jgi:DNA end-binding protein Ku